MCLAIPGEIVSINGNDPFLRTARVRFGDVIKEVSLAMTPEAEVGQFALIHAGLAINIVDEDEAAETLMYLQHIGEASPEPTREQGTEYATEPATEQETEPPQ